MKKYFNILYLLVLILIPIVLVILPADFFDSGNSICISIYMFNTECYACGLTRAIQHLIHLDFLIAYELNKLSVIVLPLLLISYFKELVRIYRILKVYDN